MILSYLVTEVDVSGRVEEVDKECLVSAVRQRKRERGGLSTHATLLFGVQRVCVAHVFVSWVEFELGRDRRVR